MNRLARSAAAQSMSLERRQSEAQRMGDLQQGLTSVHVVTKWRLRPIARSDISPCGEKMAAARSDISPCGDKNFTCSGSVGGLGGGGFAPMRWEQGPTSVHVAKKWRLQGPTSVDVATKSSPAPEASGDSEATVDSSPCAGSKVRHQSMWRKNGGCSLTLTRARPR